MISFSFTHAHTHTHYPFFRMTRFSQFPYGTDVVGVVEVAVQYDPVSVAFFLNQHDISPPPANTLFFTAAPSLAYTVEEIEKNGQHPSALWPTTLDGSTQNC